MFIGREFQLSELNRLYRSNRFEMPIIYGRRRIGKTRLITEFIKGKEAIYVQARQSNAQANLRIVSQAILSFATGSPHGDYSTFDEAFEVLATLSHKKRVVFVIDEYPYLAEAFPEISSLLQEKIDHVFKPDTQLMLVLCGSSLSFMEEQVLGYESPLYGRRTAQFKITPFDFSDALAYWPSMNREDAAVCYGFTGGVPAYMELVDPRSSAAENIERLFFNANGMLYEEPTNLLLQECRNPDQYDAIIQAIASGHSRLNEIATATKIAQSNARTYLKKLISIGIVSRELPFGETSNKRAIYALSDDMFRFWYRFVPQNMGLIQNGMGSFAFNRIKEQVSEYMGTTFERICVQSIYDMARKGELGIVPAQIGRWWGNDPRTRSQEEIDIVAEDGSRAALFAECKWRNEPADAAVLKKLVYRSEPFPYEEKHYIVFSKSGFTDGCRKLAASTPHVRLIGFDELCNDATIR